MKLSRTEFDKLALEHIDLLYRMARRMTRDDASAQDLVQDTYVRAFQSSDSFDLQEFGIRPWLIRILQNQSVSRFRKEKRQPMAIADEQLDAAATSDASGTQASGAFDAMDDEVAAAVKRLPQEYQAVLLLWAVEDMSYKEIAMACDIRIGTVMSRLHRARQKLADRLSDYARKKGLIRE